MAQTHIHLAKLLTGAPEYAPEYKWRATERQDFPEITQTLVRNLDGSFTPYVLSNQNGPIVFQHWRYKIKVEATETESLDQRIAILKAMNGRIVQLCDHIHADDGEDHTNDVRPVLCRVGEFPADHPTLDFFYVDIELTDASL